MDPMLGLCDLDQLRQRRSAKWRSFPSDVLPAFVAEMDFDVAEPIAAAVRESMAAGDYGYGHIDELGEAFATFAAFRLGWNPDPATVFVLPDVMTGIVETLLAITEPGAGVVVNPPVYPPFHFRVDLSGRQIIEAPLARDEAGRYDLDLAVVEEALSRPETQAYLLCSPHNPSGRVWSSEQLLAVAELCQRHQVPLLIDEIHAPLVLPGATYVPFLSIDHELADQAIAFCSATKGWNIPGLKCAVAVTRSPALQAAMTERWEARLPGILGVSGSIAAFNAGLPWLDAVIAQLDENRIMLASLLAAQLPGVGYVPPEASFLAWLDCQALGLGDNPAETFLERGRVALGRGPDFGRQGAGFARLTLGTSPDLIAAAVDRMAAALAP
jgi:cystathionine beta-lyase